MNINEIIYTNTSRSPWVRRCSRKEFRRWEARSPTVPPELERASISLIGTVLLEWVRLNEGPLAALVPRTEPLEPVRGNGVLSEETAQLEPICFRSVPLQPAGARMVPLQPTLVKIALVAIVLQILTGLELNCSPYCRDDKYGALLSAADWLNAGGLGRIVRLVSITDWLFRLFETGTTTCYNATVSIHTECHQPNSILTWLKSS